MIRRVLFWLFIVFGLAFVMTFLIGVGGIANLWETYREFNR